MRTPYIAVDLDLISRVSAVAAAAGRDEASIGWGLVRLWEYCWRAASDVVPRLVVAGFCGADSIESLIAFDLVRQGVEGLPPGSLRVSGLDRYMRVKKAQKEAADQVNEKRWSADRSPSRSPSRSATHASVTESVSESVTESVSESQSGGKIEDRRSKINIDERRRATAQTSETGQEPKQANLLHQEPKRAKSPRAASEWEQLWSDLQLDRWVKLATDAGLPPAEASDFDTYAVPPAQVNSLLKKIARDLETHAAAQWTDEARRIAIVDAWGAYLSSTFGAGTNPPYALTAFASPKVSIPNFDRARGET